MLKNYVTPLVMAGSLLGGIALVSDSYADIPLVVKDGKGNVIVQDSDGDTVTLDKQGNALVEDSDGTVTHVDKKGHSHFEDEEDQDQGEDNPED